MAVTNDSVPSSVRRLVPSIAEMLLTVLSPTIDREAPSPEAWAEGAEDDEESFIDGGGGAAAADPPEVLKACQLAVVQLLRRMLAIGEVDGTSLVRLPFLFFIWCSLIMRRVVWCVV